MHDDEDDGEDDIEMIVIHQRVISFELDRSTQEISNWEERIRE